MSRMVQKWLHNSNQWLFTIIVSLAAFSTYSCMYAFRKPFAVATFSDLEYWNIDYKILLISAQVIGYTLSKFAGIKIVSEMKDNKRGLGIVLLITVAAVSLLLFAIVPAPYNIIFLFLNGLPLGMVWGFVFAYLEGRRVTEILGAVLSISFIFSSGFVKTIGKYVMINWGVSSYWMPFVTGMLFFLPLLLFVWLLEQVPPPDEEDIRQRTRRLPMDKKARWSFFKTFAPGLVLLILVYAMLTAFRDFRDNFAAEIWNALGFGGQAMIFTTTEIPIALAVLVIMGMIFLIKNNMHAYMIVQLIILIGVASVGVSTYLFTQGVINPALWMTLVGMGLYFGYVPFNSVLFERMIATFKYVSTAGFLIYLADAFGYLSSIGILFYKNFGEPNISWLNFFINGTYWFSLGGGILCVLSIVYFSGKYKKWYLSDRPKYQSEPDVQLSKL